MDLQDIRNQPPVTRALMAGMCALATLVTLGGMSPLSLSFEPERVVAGELWRPVTSLLFTGRLNMFFIATVLHICTFSGWLEESYYGNSRDYLWAIFVMATTLLAVSPGLGIRYPSDALFTALMYMWSRCCANQRAAVLLVIPIPTGYLAYYSAVVTSLLHPPMASSQLLGVGVGHIMYYFSEIYPLWTGRHLLKAPFSLGEQRN